MNDDNDHPKLRLTIPPKERLGSDKMSQPLNFVLEHLKRGQRKDNSNNASSSDQVPSVQSQDTGNGNAVVVVEPSSNSEKSPISALIQKFSGSSSPVLSSSSGHGCPMMGGGPLMDSMRAAAGANNDSNNNNSLTKSLNSVKSNANDKSGGDEVDCSSAIRSSDSVVVRVNSVGKVNNNPSYKLSVNSSAHHQTRHQEVPSFRKKSDAGLSRGLLNVGNEDKNGIPSRRNSNGHIANSGRKMSADLRRDLLNEEGKHFAKPLKVKNWGSKTEAYDMLHNKTDEKVSE